MTGDAILLGAGGHARVVRALAEALGWWIIGVCDPALAAGAYWEGLLVLGGDEALDGRNPGQMALLNGLGKMPGQSARHRVQQVHAARGFAFPALVHPAAWVAPDARLGAGVQVMAGAVVQPGCTLGPGCIVNTRAGLDHDATLGADVHLAPGVTVCGGVHVGDGAFIGAGATVIQGCRIGAGAMVAAGSVVAADLPPGARHPRAGHERTAI
ncbi:acetyltransferase [Tabrizicola sp.]|uniref:acetyltransferase n=1 Tax=Tabrizicola sp. TaxID=2005166 RepID=UPI0026151969|nr:acetyltransferase [Tabrizicola sp.]MDM7932021.1 acetyltransferase [Tabrizicola sp.]